MAWKIALALVVWATISWLLARDMGSVAFIAWIGLSLLVLPRLPDRFRGPGVFLAILLPFLVNALCQGKLDAELYSYEVFLRDYDSSAPSTPEDSTRAAEIQRSLRPGMVFHNPMTEKEVRVLLETLKAVESDRESERQRLEAESRQQ